MFQLLFVLFIVIPLFEIYLLIKVGGVIGAFNTVALVIITAILGAWLLRMQGFSTLRRVRRSMEKGEIPAIEMLAGVLLAISGAFLLTPGFFTDALGFLLLVPAVRRGIVLWFLGRFDVVQWSQNHPSHHRRGRESDRRNRTIEGDYWRDDDRS